IEDLPKVIMSRKGSRLTEQRLVPFEAARHVAYPYDRPRALHRVPLRTNSCLDRPGSNRSSQNLPYCLCRQAGQAKPASPRDRSSQNWRITGYPETTRTIPYLITLCSLSISTVFSIGRASIVCPLPVIVVALNIEL